MEKMTATKARNCLNRKPNKWGVKLFVLAHRIDGFISGFSIYWYKSTFPAGPGPHGQNNFVDIDSICLGWFLHPEIPMIQRQHGIGARGKKKKKSNYIYKQLGQINSENTL